MRPKFNEASVPALLASTEYENFVKLNATRDNESKQLEGSLSSTIALIIVLTIIFSLIMTSLGTYCFHKWKLRGKKLQKAQEEYQKDHEKSMFQRGGLQGGGLQMLQILPYHLHSPLPAQLPWAPNTAPAQSPTPHICWEEPSAAPGPSPQLQDSLPTQIQGNTPPTPPGFMQQQEPPPPHTPWTSLSSTLYPALPSWAVPNPTPAPLPPTPQGP
uniref:Uncharacterized protein n=1 Tax=Crocodylus porosus TaxID=8502 RepID=A0A7M4EI84_CROPO